ncbi:hypothetical protein FRX31_021406 [Thalictrum thalictroides]|uniref:Uncharacterized protein n=1 Tax=Thalictrum thalictroides TaxID=46969 RepID=A0A7J6VV79_THATH|nr:hypothetical protein FRX31_021406 [Thalictrum thalictroides]
MKGYQCWLREFHIHGNNQYFSTIAKHVCDTKHSIFQVPERDARLYLTISGGVFETNGVISASLTWSDGVHNVRKSNCCVST